MAELNDFGVEGETAPSGGGLGFVPHLPTILWQRRWLIIIPFVLLSAAGLAAALLMPKVYRSSATLLVEAQELPSAVVSASVPIVIDQRIAKIRQQVLSRGDLIALIQQNDLYPKQRETKPLSSVVATMVAATQLHAIDNDLSSAPAGPGTSNTIAFVMSFDYSDPAKAQAVMQSFVSRFLELDASTSQEQATSTVSFLEDQGKRLQRQIAEIEGRITALKERNGQALAGGGAPIPMTSDAQGQIAALETANRQLLAQSQRSTKDPLITEAERQLAVLRSVYTDRHPDVVRARQRLEDLRRQPKQDSTSPDGDLIQQQVEANNRQIASLRATAAGDAARAASAASAQARAPAIAEEAGQLTSQAGILRSQYEDVASNILKAQNLARMAQEQKNEHLSVVETPSFPDTPIKPNRPLLAAGGVGAGLGLGLVLALAVELLVGPVRGVGQVTALGLTTLAVVPTLKPDAEVVRGWRRMLPRRLLPAWLSRRRPAGDVA